MVSDQQETQVTSIRAITYNVFGLKVLSPRRTERLEEIGVQLAKASPIPEIVALQECWTQADYENIRKHTRTILPYAKYYYSGAFGGGLAILSKWPIEESSMHRYSLNGRPTAFFRGDWYVGKGAACAKIRIGRQPKDIVEVFCTHFHAPYEEGTPADSYICHRISQAWEISKLMRDAADRGHLVLGMGDFNMLPLALSHRLITSIASVHDTWRLVHPDSSLGPAYHPEERRRKQPTPSARHNLLINGAASDNILNTWRWSKKDQKQLFKGKNVIVNEGDDDINAKRLDYIFCGAERNGDRHWQVRDIRVGMVDRHPILNCSLSDHFSVEASLHIVRGPVTTEAIPPLSPAMLEEILACIATYSRRQARQKTLRMSHFFAAILIALGCFVGVWWSPHNYIAFLLMLLSTFGLAYGMIDGLIAGIFIAWEKRALKEFEWEVRNRLGMLRESVGESAQKAIVGAI